MPVGQAFTLYHLSNLRFDEATNANAALPIIHCVAYLSAALFFEKLRREDLGFRVKLTCRRRATDGGEEKYSAPEHQHAVGFPRRRLSEAQIPDEQGEGVAWQQGFIDGKKDGDGRGGTEKRELMRDLSGITHYVLPSPLATERRTVDNLGIRRLWCSKEGLIGNLIARSRVGKIEIGLSGLTWPYQLESACQDFPGLIGVKPGIIEPDQPDWAYHADRGL
ncbi:hypothetical protein B0H19DRAFT_1068846 [Mycena capillaripes]|nr:hypothetical protein B0H19DRAFT_1068846 [Mycena capillaripes]